MIVAYLYTLYHRKRCDYVVARFTIPILTYFIVGALVGLVFFIASPDYNYFLGIKS